tara:strand:- start:699 stop:1034 length:336 start_codon:yes stop_codon:yes gene_type:complete
MKKAEIWMGNLNPSQGSKQAGFRPLLIVSGNLLNTHSPVVWVCPLTSKIKNYKGDLILNPNKKNGLTQQSEVLAMHFRSISKSRLIEKLGTIEANQLAELRKSLNEIMELD